MTAMGQTSARPNTRVNPHGRIFGPLGGTPAGNPTTGVKPKLSAKVVAKMGRILGAASRFAAKTPLTVAAFCGGFALGAAAAYIMGHRVKGVDSGKKINLKNFGKKGPKAVAPVRKPAGPQTNPQTKPAGPKPAGPSHPANPAPHKAPSPYKPDHMVPGPDRPARIPLPDTKVAPKTNPNQEQVDKILAERNVEAGHADATQKAKEAETRLGVRNVEELRKKHADQLAAFAAAKKAYKKAELDWVLGGRKGDPPIEPKFEDFGT